jgi:EF-hand domain pair
MAQHDRDRTTLDYIKPGAENVGRLREDFDFNDLNKDGRLTLGEFIRYMQSVDENMTAEECQIGFDEIDANGDGAIGFDEFLAWWSEPRRPPAAPPLRRHVFNAFHQRRIEAEAGGGAHLLTGRAPALWRSILSRFRMRPP